MKVLYLTKYTSAGASSRMRSFQYFPYLENSDLKISVSTFFNDRYLETLYNGNKNSMLILKAYLKRFFVLFTVFRYDRVVIEYEIFPYFPAWIEKFLSKLGIKYIVDYDDAIFHNYDLNANKWIKKLLGNKIDQVMKFSSVVVAGNQYLAKRAKIAGAKKIIIIPTVIDLKEYKTKRDYESKKFRIGWIGSPSTYKYVENIKKGLTAFANQRDAEIVIVGAFTQHKSEPPFVFVPWQKHTETQWIRSFDVGLMPLDDTPWSRGKCSFKLIQYMAAGIPVIASPVGMNKEVVTERNGFLANSSEEWYNSLSEYAENVSLRKKHGVEGRKIVEKKYALQVTAEAWKQLLMNNGNI
ncbi:glycosyltransferase family 4 protein [Chryseobacterium caseinilyticum]|uniref:Glycosyltransferase family 4 protein n=1 Tax=Chryseobacterium caseinilyticum TaxID=2771428 RepID=A0ABR8ZH37_9FLAO|nr:glycosyltransferase family 4 protein [Chryseobacterium caseinilyticum]MBD8084618.1 glycosyltransferase family 4 protein [Chryseobacterium caseinilyticum]